MQNHLDASQRSFTSMLGSDPFGPPSHDFTALSNHNHGSPASDFGHLLNNHNSSSNPAAQPNNHHHHHHNNNNNHTANNNNNNGSGGGAETKPKKAPPPNGKKTKGRVKIKMEFIDNKLRRYTTFSKRKTGIMKKAYELSTLTGTQVMLLVASETGHVYTFATRKLQPMITSEAGKALIQTCLNSPDPPNSGSDTQRMSATGYEETELTYAADPNASDHGDTKDDESETGSSDGEEPKEVPPLLPLTNGLLPPNFAALLASATAAAGLGGSKGPLSIDLVPSAANVALAARSALQNSQSGPSSSSVSHSNHQHHHHQGSSASATSTSSSNKSRIKREVSK